MSEFQTGKPPGSFIDETRLRVTAGNGGNGCVAFRREKFIPRGGPFGGNGGKGGDIVLLGDSQKGTLLDLHRRRHIKAKHGVQGMGNNMAGRRGDDAIIRVPTGTMVYDDETGEELGDLVENDERLIVANGGRGGLGNSCFKTSTRQAPDFATDGKPGETRLIRLELKVLADIGIIGFPSVGKSTLISRISNARPKIAAYPFTTLVPNLGLVQWRDLRSFVVADLPGLIEGAHRGRGLGHRFLRHLGRVRAIVHMVEVPEAGAEELGVERDPLRDYNAIRDELEAFDPSLSKLPEVVALNKLDIPESQEQLPDLQEHFAQQGTPFVGISAVTGANIQQLLDLMGEMVFSKEED